MAVRFVLGHAGTKERSRKMSGSIVCGVDGSADSERALEVAAQLANRLGSKLVLAHVGELAHVPYAAAAPFGGMAGRITVAEEIEVQEEAGRRLLDQVARDADLTDVERKLEFGSPAEALADLADEEEAELIVVGSRGRGAFTAAFLGSVSSSLVGIARCPVLIVPHGVANAR
jgi:nucleotide-binding universal stress UspA family protein